MGRWAVGQMGDDQAVGRPVVFVDDDDVGEAVFDGLSHDLLEGGVLPPHGLRLRDHSTQFFDESDCFLKNKIMTSYVALFVALACRQLALNGSINVFKLFHTIRIAID